MAQEQLIFPAHRECHLDRVCSLLCGIVLLIWCFMMATVKRGATSRAEVYFLFHKTSPPKKKKKKTRGGHNVIYFMSPLGELDAQLQLWDTLSCNGKRFLLVASQGHHLVSLWLWLASVNFSFVVSVVWRKRKVHKSHRRVTNRCLTLARPVVCISHFVLWI